MLLLRIGRRGRWTRSDTPTEADVEKASQDLALRSDEEGLSVYRVNDAAQAKEIATVWALEHRERDDDADYILFDEAEAQPTHTLVAREDKGAQSPLLRAQHQELEERVEGAHLRLAARLLASPDLQVHRVSRHEIAAARRARGTGTR